MTTTKERVSYLLEGKEMMQMELAEKIGKSANHLSQVINGRRNGSEEMWIAMADELDTTVAWLTIGQGPMIKALPDLEPILGGVQPSKPWPRDEESVKSETSKPWWWRIFHPFSC